MKVQLLLIPLTIAQAFLIPIVSLAAPNEGNNPTEAVNGTIDDVNNTVDDVDDAIDGAGDTLNETVNNTIDDVVGGETQDIISSIFGSFRNVGSLISRITGLGHKIAGLLSDFNLDKILDIIDIDLDDITGDGKIYQGEASAGGFGGATNGSDILAGIEAGEMGLQPIDEVDQAIDEAGSSRLMEFLGGRQEKGGYAAIQQTQNLARTNQADAVAEATALGEAGQAKLKDNTERSNDALKTSTAMMEDSEEQDISQNIMRNMSTQQHEMTVHTGFLAVDAQLRARDDSMRNVLLGRSLKELMGERVSQQREKASAHAGVMVGAGGFYLPGLGDDDGGFKGVNPDD